MSSAKENIQHSLQRLSPTLLPLLLWIALSSSLQLWMLPKTASAQETRATLKISAGHDSNPRRDGGDAVLEDQLLQVFFKGQNLSSLGPLGWLKSKLLLGGKRYLNTPDEDALVSSITLQWSRSLLRWESSNIGGSLRVNGADRAEGVLRRGYTRGSGVAGLFWQIDPVVLSVGAGQRIFFYKPDPSSDHYGRLFEGSGRIRLGDRWSLSADYQFSERNFEVDRLINVEGGVSIDQGVLRKDRLQSFGLGGSWRGQGLLKMRYALLLNSSNSVGPALKQHLFEAGGTLPLPLSLVLNLRASIQITQYDDPIRLDETLQIEDENRNLVASSLRYAPGGPFQIELRHAIYVQTFGDAVHFSRQMLSLGLILDLNAETEEKRSEAD